MRTISEIKDSITAVFMQNEDVAKAYGFNPGDTFSAHFSRVSVESVLFYVFASAAWALENLFVEHKKEVDTLIESIMPHRPKWYRDKVLNFMINKVLIPGTDIYDTTGMSAEDITAAQVVKHAVAVESIDASLMIKVAGEGGGKRCKLDEQTKTELEAYIAEVKDAGVKINLINAGADVFNCDVDIYYNPLLLPDTVKDNCRAAIKNYIGNLPFNGEYTNMSLVDHLQVVEGVVIAELKGATAKAGGAEQPEIIDARYVPAAGYFTAGVINIIMRAYEQL